jgi:hypothetical protein
MPSVRAFVSQLESSVLEWNQFHVERLSLDTGGRMMLVERGVQVPSVEVVSDAYAIAANYLRRSGAIPDTVQPNDQLVDIVVQLFQRGEFNKLKLANKAISIFEAEHAA